MTIPKSKIRAENKPEHQEVARNAWEKMLKLKRLQAEDPEDIVTYILLHPVGRRQFLFYCARKKMWRIDRLDDWEYYHLSALKDLAKAKKLW